ncbi:MAG: MIase like protein [Nitrososphaerota archaeon]
MLFLVRVKVRQPEQMSQKQLMQAWQREAEAALGALKAGRVKGLYKVTGRREAIAILDVSSHEELDRILEGLPIVRELGPWVRIDVTPIHPYESFYELIRKMASEAG